MASSNPGSLPDAPNQQVRVALVERIKTLLAINDWTQQEAARLCGQRQPRISDLRRGAAARFSLDALVNIAAALERHSHTREGNAMEYTDEDGQRLAAEFMAKLASRPIQGRYPAATESSTTERGGKIVATSGISTVGGRVALVGDVVRYPNGSESRIVSGAGQTSVYLGQPIALVGSDLDNGDKINGPMHNGMAIVQYADEPPIKGLFERGDPTPRSNP